MMKMNTQVDEYSQAHILASAMLDANTNVVAGDDEQVWYYAKDGVITHRDGTPYTADALALSLRVHVEPGYIDTDGEDPVWKDSPAIPRPVVRALMESPDLVNSLRLPQPVTEGVTDGWVHVDLTKIDKTPSVPTVLFREDGKPLLYQGKVNTIFGDSESGKSWICLLACAQVLKDGGSVAYLDYEDDAGSVSGRLVTMGVPEGIINDPTRFLYFKLHKGLSEDALDWYREPHTQEVSEGVYASRTGFIECSLVVIDAMTEALSADGLSSNSDVDVAGWFNGFARRIAALGPAVAVIDHMNLSDKSRVTGSQMKKSAVEGTSIRVLKGKSFDLAHGGHSDLYVAKDRNAAVRAIAIGEKQYLGRFLVPDPIGADGGMRDARITEPVEGPGAEAAEAATEFLLNAAVDEVLAAGKTISVKSVGEQFRGSGGTIEQKVLSAWVARYKAEHTEA